MKDKIIKKIERLGGSGVSLVELSEIEGFAGEFEWGALDKNIVFWANISDVAVDALNELLRDKQIDLTPCNPLIYMVDGVMLTYPVAKKAMAYKSPHWCPITLQLVRKKAK